MGGTLCGCCWGCGKGSGLGAGVGSGAGTGVDAGAGVTTAGALTTGGGGGVPGHIQLASAVAAMAPTTAAIPIKVRSRTPNTLLRFPVECPSLSPSAASFTILSIDLRLNNELDMQLLV